MFDLVTRAEAKPTRALHPSDQPKVISLSSLSLSLRFYILFFKNKFLCFAFLGFLEFFWRFLFQRVDAIINPLRGNVEEDTNQTKRGRKRPNTNNKVVPFFFLLPLLRIGQNKDSVFVSESHYSLLHNMKSPKPFTSQDAIVESNQYPSLCFSGDRLF